MWVQQKGDGDYGSTRKLCQQIVEKARARLPNWPESAPRLALRTVNYLQTWIGKKRSFSAYRYRMSTTPCRPCLDRSMSISFLRVRDLWQVILQAEPEYRYEPQGYRSDIYVRNEKGHMVPLSRSGQDRLDHWPRHRDPIQQLSRCQDHRWSRSRGEFWTGVGNHGTTCQRYIA